jgi:hypothetical protein
VEVVLDPHGGEACNNDHSREPTTDPGVTCELIEDIDENCVNAAILKCSELGAWSVWNQCQSYAADVISKCMKHDRMCSE